MSLDSEWRTTFSGIVRLFPLPNLVLFPHVVQGLHIFEPRYRQMMADTLAGDQLMALVMLKPNWEAEYDRKPAIESIACLGRVGVHELLPDGRYNLRLIGLSRIRLLEELSTDKLYRQARAELLDDICDASIAELMSWRAKLRTAVLSRYDDTSPAHQQLVELIDSDLPLGQLCDLLTFALPFPADFKQAQLAEQTVIHRADRLIQVLEIKARTRQFPPQFSQN